MALPPEVRARVVALASERLGQLPAEAVPVALRQVARFTPAKRARTGAAQLAAALETDPTFRQTVAELVKQRHPELTDALATGTDLPAAPVEEVAALAYLLRSPDWQQRVDRAADELRTQRTEQASAAQVDAVQRLTEQLEATRATARAELQAQKQALQEVELELAAVRRKVREMGDRAGRAEQARDKAEQAQVVAEQALTELRAAQQGQLQALRNQLRDTEVSLESARTAAREGRSDDQLRLRLLLDSLLGAAQGLRRELALPPAESRPADALQREQTAAAPPLQGRSAEDPVLLDALLAVPLTHLVVDGYNVTKTGYPTLTLEAQRGRLLTALGSLASRLGVEVTVVFDGVSGAVPLAVPAPRGVRLLFSSNGEIADELIRRIVRLEPLGRPLVVVSSDKEVAQDVTRSGARAVPSIALVRLLERGSVRPTS